MPLNPLRMQAVFLEAANCHDITDSATIQDRECAGDSETRRRIEALLRAHDRFNELVNQPRVGPSWLDCGELRNVRDSAMGHD
jgi:hypothetical protein